MGKFSEYNEASELSINDWVLALRTLSGNELAVQKASFLTLAKCIDKSFIRGFTTITTNYSCSVNEKIYADLSSNSIIVRLPAVTISDRFSKVEIIATSVTNYLLTIDPFGSPINGQAGNRTISALNGIYFCFVYVNATVGWIDLNQALNTNIFQPSIVNNQFQVYTGDGVPTRSITSTVYNPDLFLIHYTLGMAPRWFSPGLGINSGLPWVSNSNLETYSSDAWLGYGSNGYTINIGNSSYSNQSTVQYRMWSMRASKDSGLSVIRYKGNGAVRTIQHGLSAKPSLIVIKALNSATRWIAYIAGLPQEETKYITFEGYEAVTTDSTMWNNTIANTSNFTLGTSAQVNANNVEYICYVWAKSNSFDLILYQGTGVANLTLYPGTDSGFTPIFYWVKRLAGGHPWVCGDTTATNPIFIATGGDSNLTTTAGISIITSGLRFTDTNPTYNEAGVSYVAIVFKA